MTGGSGRAPGSVPSAFITQWALPSFFGAVNSNKLLFSLVWETNLLVFIFFGHPIKSRWRWFPSQSSNTSKIKPRGSQRWWQCGVFSLDYWENISSTESGRTKAWALHTTASCLSLSGRCGDETQCWETQDSNFDKLGILGSEVDNIRFVLLK